MMQDLAFAIPGVDEAMSFAEIMKYVTPLPHTQVVPKRVTLQARQVDAILCYRLRYCSYGTYTPIPFLPHCVGEGTRKAQHSRLEVWSYDQSGRFYTCFVVANKK